MGPCPDTGCACGGGLAVLIAGIALAGCGGSGATTTTTSAPVASSTAPTTTTNSTGAGSKPTSSGAAKGKAGGSAPSPGACAAAWNRTGPAPSLEHVLLPSLRASGPFPAQVGRASGRCALI